MGHIAERDFEIPEFKDLGFFAVSVNAGGVVQKYVIAAQPDLDAVMKVRDEKAYITSWEGNVVGPLLVS